MGAVIGWFGIAMLLVVLGIAIFRKDLARNTRILLFAIAGFGIVALVAVFVALTS